MDFVMDSSITLSWCFGDEATPFTQALLEKSAENKVFVPNLWPLEIGNVLVMAEKKQRISYAQITEFISLLDELNIEVDKQTCYKALHEILALAHSEGLTTYDAAYLELAMRLGLSLASKDQKLCLAASRLGVNVLHE